MLSDKIKRSEVAKDKTLILYKHSFPFGKEKLDSQSKHHEVPIKTGGTRRVMTLSVVSDW